MPWLWSPTLLSAGASALFKGDKVLVNTYHTLAQPAGTTPGVDTAVKFIEFVASPEGQQIIRDYSKKKKIWGAAVQGL